jgi:hypothetical protein
MAADNLPAGGGIDDVFPTWWKNVSISPSTEQVLPVVAQEQLNAELDDGPEEQADDGPRRGVRQRKMNPRCTSRYWSIYIVGMCCGRGYEM